MTAGLGDKACVPGPLLLRFVQPTARPNISIQYDRATQVNVPKGRRVPAVWCGLDVKTYPPGPGED